MTVVARLSIWSYFILIIDQPLMLASLKFGADAHPIYFALVLSAALLVAAIAIVPNPIRRIDDGRMFFLAFAGLAVLGIAMYRGENVGGDFGGLLLFAGLRPNGLGYVVWPALNLAAAAGLFLLARPLRKTIVAAAFAALLIQVSTMEADMWWPALFGDANGRAGGLAGNANEAALLVTVLASLMLPAAPGERFNRFAVYAVTLAIAAVAFSQSKSGGIAIIICIACFLRAARRTAMPYVHPAYIAGLVAVVAATVALSPVLNPTKAQIEQGQRTVLAEANIESHLPAATLDAPVSLSERLESRVSIDEPITLRRGALIFFFDIFKQNPLGVGTGFTNKFATGPHNEWLKLAVDEGIAAAVLWAVMLCAAVRLAFRSGSPALTSLAAIAWVASFVDHTILVDPVILAALGSAMGMASQRDHVDS